jgi:hypothetical protein
MEVWIVLTNIEDIVLFNEEIDILKQSVMEMAHKWDVSVPICSEDDKE